MAIRRPVLAENTYDAVVVGSGPNGLAAAITFARAKRSVLLLEAGETIGGGMRTKELTLPGFYHDVCAAIHPLALASPFFRSLDLTQFGLSGFTLLSLWLIPLTMILPFSWKEQSKIQPRVSAATRMHTRVSLNPLFVTGKDLSVIYSNPEYSGASTYSAAFFSEWVLSARSVVERCFRDKRARALFAGNSCHSILPLEAMSSGAFGIMLSMVGHAVGWPMAKGGSQSIANALASCFLSLGGEIKVDTQVSSIKDLPQSQVVLFDVSPRNPDRIVGDRFPTDYRQSLQGHRHGPGVFKVDWALDGPIPRKD